MTIEVGRLLLRWIKSTSRYRTVLVSQRTPQKENLSEAVPTLARSELLPDEQSEVVLRVGSGGVLIILTPL